MTLVMSAQEVAAVTADIAVAAVVTAGALSTITDATAAAEAVTLIARAPVLALALTHARVPRPTREGTRS